MKISIFNLLSTELSDRSTGLEAFYKDEFKDAQVQVIDVAADELKDCIGCWSCWVRTPGLCVHQDAMSDIYKKIISSDRIVLALPNQQGFIKGSAKTFIDRLIPLYHPYIQIHENEMMHFERYAHYPEFEFYIEREGLSDEEDQLIEDYCYRMSHHFRQDAYKVFKEEASFKRSLLTPRQPMEDTIWQSIDEKNDKIVIYNGSPRGKKGNSLKIINQIVEGIKSEGISEENIVIRHLVNQNLHDEWAESFHEYSRHLFVFPLYVHAMPGIVMKFFEKLSPSSNGQTQISYFVQSGFSEGFQSHYLMAYLSRLPKRLNCKYGGILIKGGMEALQVKPEQANKRLYEALKSFGKAYVRVGKMPVANVKQLESKTHMSRVMIMTFNLLAKTGLTNFYWDMLLKKNNAFEKRFDKPYA